jgi:hypothetical protein
MAETAAQRYARDYGSMSAERKNRELDVQGDTGSPDSRTNRLYVDDSNSTTAVNKTN